MLQIMASFKARNVLRLLGTLLCVMIPVQSFKVTHLELPTYLDPREWTELVCRYDLGDKNLMILRWFGNGEELIRYMPTQDPNLLHQDMQVYNSSWLSLESGPCVPGACSIRVLAIPRPQITNATTAMFRCEISSVITNSYYAEDYKEDMVGYASPPKVDPTITGLPEFVEVGDQMRLNCSTDYSWPQSQITWYINDHLVRVNASKVGLVNETFILRTSWDTLEFAVTEEDLTGGASLGVGSGSDLGRNASLGDSSGVITVRCQSSVEEFGKSRSTEYNLQTKAHALSISSSGFSIGFTRIQDLFVLELLITIHCSIILL